MITMKKTLAAMIAAISISGTAVMAADTKESITEIPNPITEYRTYGEVSAALGFSPLYLPGLAGYQCRYISAISGKTGDIRYVKDDGSEIMVRSSRAGSMENISGVYGTSWKQRRIGDTMVSVAGISKNTWAAYWKNGPYVFSAYAEHMTETEFFRLLADGPVDITEHYFRPASLVHASKQMALF